MEESEMICIAKLNIESRRQKLSDELLASEMSYLRSRNENRKTYVLPRGGELSE